MTIKSFKGGIHPPTRKEASVGKRLAYFMEPKQVVVPMNQHFGAPNQSLVKVGDTVKKGQRIADAEGRMTLPVHAPIAGTVKKIEPRAQSNNLDGPCIIIENDGSGATDFMPPLDAFSCTKEEALARIRDAGIGGMGGAGFPVYVKLAPPPNKPIDTVIANGAECEPYLTIDEQTMHEMPEKVVEGLAIVMKVVGVKKGIIAMEEDTVNLVPVFEKAIAAAGHGFDITVQVLREKYPQGGEKMIITAVTGRQVPSGGLPMDVGCIVQNVGSLKAIADAFLEGKPLIDRGFTLSGGACSTPGNIIVPIGTLISDLPPELLAYDADKLRKILFGGPMMGVAVPRMDIPVQKNTSGVLLMTAKEAVAHQEGPCIRCGRCIKACSCLLTPVLINAALQAGELEESERCGLMDCVECGACAFACPSRIHLVQRFRVGKQVLRNKKAAQAKPPAGVKA